MNKNRDVCGDTKDAEALVLGARARRAGQRDPGASGVARGKQPAAEVVLDNASACSSRHVTAVMPASARA